MAPAPTPTRTRARGFTPGRVVAVVAALAIVALWIWAFTAAQQPLPDQLDDDAFATSAQVACQQAQDQVDALPPAYEAASALDRAEVIDTSNDLYRAMVGRLAAAAPSTERDGAMVQEWLGDWEAYIADRDDYAQRLRMDEGARFYVSEKAGDQVTEPVDRFAKVNAMEACATPADLS